MRGGRWARPSRSGTRIRPRTTSSMRGSGILRWFRPCRRRLQTPTGIGWTRIGVWRRLLQEVRFPETLTSTELLRVPLQRSAPSSIPRGVGLGRGDGRGRVDSPGVRPTAALLRAPLAHRNLHGHGADRQERHGNDRAAERQGHGPPGLEGRFGRPSCRLLTLLIDRGKAAAVTVPPRVAPGRGTVRAGRTRKNVAGRPASPDYSRVLVVTRFIGS